MKKKEQKLTLCQWMIQKIDTKSYRAGKDSYWLHPKVDQKMIDAIGSLRELTAQAREMERDPVLGQKVKIDWRDMGNDIRKIDICVDIMEELCRREGIEDPRMRQLRYIHEIQIWKDQASVEWLDPYYDGWLMRLEAGDEIKDADMEDRHWFVCLHAAACNEQPVWERIFSSAVLGDMELKDEQGKTVPPSKRFQKKYKSRVCSVLKKYSPHYEDGMTDEELLTAHGILAYAQTLEWKGPLQYRLEDSVIDTSCQRYGTVLNAQTLERAVPVSISGVKRILIIENKANYESMSYAEDTLYIYCHGFFSPKERAFLQYLPTLAGKTTEFLHWGDMDYGGIRIFQFNQKHLFSVMRPWRMGREDYENALQTGAGVELESTKRVKLEQMDAGMLEELKCCILEHHMEIEQEVLLARKYLEEEVVKHGF